MYINPEHQKDLEKQAIEFNSKMIEFLFGEKEGEKRKKLLFKKLKDNGNT
jgi:hypothetical protein